MTQESGNKPIRHTKKHVARLEREQKQSRIILYTFFGVLATVIGLLLYGYLDVKYFQLQKPVAKVGDVEISLSAFQGRVRLQRQQLLSQYNDYYQFMQIYGFDLTQQLQQIEGQLNSPSILGRSVLNQMIREELVRQEAAKRGITVSDEEVEAEIRAVFAYYPNGSPTPTITPTTVVMPEVPAEAFKVVTQTPPPTNIPTSTATPEILETPASDSAAQESTPTLEPTAEPTLDTPEATPTITLTPTITPTATPYTLESYQQQVDNTVMRIENFGVTDAEYREIIRAQLLEAKLREVVTADITATQEQIWARHILVPDEETAKGLIEKLNAGADFAELAANNSLDTSNAQNGGDLGWFGKGAMVSEFEAAAFALVKPGDITQTPVKTSFGYHIIQLIARQDRPLTAEELKQAKDNAFGQWVTSAREEYGVETYDDFWIQHVPDKPDFISAATEAAGYGYQTQTAAAALSTGTPQP